MQILKAGDINENPQKVLKNRSFIQIAKFFYSLSKFLK